LDFTSFDELTVRMKKAMQNIYDNFVTKTDAQTLTNKTLTSPTIVGGTSTAIPVGTVYSADGAIAISEGIAVLTKTSAAAMTLAAPTTGQNGTIITILSRTAFAHVVTCTGATFLNGTATALTTLTFAAYAGASIRLIADNGKWCQSGNTAVTAS